MKITRMFRQAIAGFAIALASIVATDSRAQIFVFSTAGARCTLTDARTGAVYETFVMQDMGHEHSVHTAQNFPPGLVPIAVSCSKDGYEPKSVTVSVVPMHWISTSAPCTAPPQLSDEQQTTYCLNYGSLGVQHYFGPPAMGYPRANVELTPLTKK